MMAHFLIYIKRGQAKGKSVFVTDDGVICKVISIDKDKPMIRLQLTRQYTHKDLMLSYLMKQVWHMFHR